MSNTSKAVADGSVNPAFEDGAWRASLRLPAPTAQREGLVMRQRQWTEACLFPARIY
jgi:hypothetical protein